MKGGPDDLPPVLGLHHGQLRDLAGVEALDSNEVVQQLQDELLGRVEAAVRLFLLRDERLEILAVLQEPQEEHGDDGVLQCQAVRHVVDVGRQVHQILVVLVFIDGLMFDIERFVQIKECFKHLSLVEEILERSLSDQSESEEISEHLLPLQWEELVQPHLALVLVIVPGSLPALH